ncbi:proteoglycan 4-like isoform X2 [Homarus americanus]|uniref:proteoglycan 4-like isoform X2 n=1 Tax=Homarus americanus TaxID=6706 RepID=UPI001C496509|nr:proteoglycan 4-like isoform X2 [Homarus americanus]
MVMAKAALLLVTLLLAGFAWAQESRGHPRPNDQKNDPPAQAVHDPAVDDDEDEYTGSPSRHQPTVTRQSLFPDDDESYELSDSVSRPLVRRRPGARRRRPLDPERRRLLLLRRQQLGLPIRKRIRTRPQYPEDQVEETPQLVTTEKPAPTYSFPTTSSEPTVFTSTSTSTSMSTSSISSSTSTTSRSSFPSFTAASKLRERYKKIRGGWGMKTNIKDEESKSTEDESVELESTPLSTRGLTARRRGVARVLNRPLPRRLTPIPVPSPTTTPAPTEAPQRDKRLRYRPVLTRKKSTLKAKSTTVTPYTTSRIPTYEREPPSYEPDSPVYKPKPSRYEHDYEPEPEPPSYNHDKLGYEPESPVYEDDSPSYNPRPNLYEPKASESPVSEQYESEPYYFETEPSAFEQVTEAKYTPVPKKVVLDPLTTTPHSSIEVIYAPQDEDYDSFEQVYDPQAPVYDPRYPVYDPRDPVYTSLPVYTTEPAYDHDPVRTTDQVYDQEPVYASDFRYAPKSVYASGPVYAPEPAYDEEPVYAPEPAYDEKPVYAPEPAYDEEPVYAPEPAYDEEPVYAPEPAYDEEPVYAPEPAYDEDSQEYLDDDYEDKPGIFDQYKYGYNVESKDTGNYHARYEARDGRTVSGSYKVALPDGRVQVVTYVADDKGFRAEVNYEGEENTPTPPEPPAPTPPVRKSGPSVVGPVPRPSPHHPTHPGPRDTGYFSTQNPNVPQVPDHPPTRPRLLPHPTTHHSSRERPHASPADQKLHFHEHVATVSPNPFRLVVERGRASTLAPPPHTTTLPTYTPTHEIVQQPTTTSAPLTTTPYPPVTNAHMTDNGFRSTATSKIKPSFSHNNNNNYHAPSSSHVPISSHTPNSQHSPTSPRTPTTTKATNAHTITPPHTTFQNPTPAPVLSSTPVYQYNSEDQPASHTTLYSPDSDSVAYLHTLGRSHVVPVLLPYTSRPTHHSRTQKHAPAHLYPRHETPTHLRQNVLPAPPRTYFLNQRSRTNLAHDVQEQHDGDSVEILRGDDHRPRLSLKIPAPHETDIYPSPPPLYHF